LILPIEATFRDLPGDALSSFEPEAVLHGTILNSVITYIRHERRDGQACYAFWQEGDFIKNDEPQGNQVFCQMNECIPQVWAMRACVKERSAPKFSLC
jgi:hypothetical protein